MGLDVSWRYGDPRDALGADPSRYADPGQVAAVCAAALEVFVSASILVLRHLPRVLSRPAHRDSLVARAVGVRAGRSPGARLIRRVGRSRYGLGVTMSDRHVVTLS